MKKFILVIIVILLHSCSNEEPRSASDLSERTKKALIEVDDFYRSDQGFNASSEEIKKKIEAISKKYNLKLIPLSYEQYHKLFQSTTSAKVMCVCCGTVTHLEVVDEGGGCFGIVRQYANGSSSISAYCDNGATYQGYYCYE